MNTDTIGGTAKQAHGAAKETIGAAMGDEKLRSEGVCDQVKGDAQKAYAKTRDFVKENPAAVTALAGVLGLAVLGSIRKRA